MANSDLLPVKITVNLNGSQFRVGLRLYASPGMFEKAMSSKGSIPKEAKTLKAEIETYVDKAYDILDHFPKATQKMFINLFKSDAGLRVSGKTDMDILFQSKIEELKEEDRAGSISFYRLALSAFKQFKKGFYLEI